jgi:hypothetical protein
MKHMKGLVQYLFDKDERFILASNDTGGAAVYDIPKRRVVPLIDKDAGAYAFDDTGVLIGRADGEVLHWTAGSDSPGTPVLNVGGEITRLAAQSGWLLAVVDQHEAVRVTVPALTRERIALPEEVVGAVIQRDGRVWLLAKGGTVQRWDVGSSTAVPFDTTEPIDLLIPTEDGVQMHASKSLLTVDRAGQRHVTPVMSLHYQQMSKTLSLVGSPNGTVGVIDLTTGEHFEIPQNMTFPSLTASGTRFGYLTGFTRDRRWRFAYWDLEIPRDPAALQKWLANVTNAIPVPDSDAVAWPDH